MVLQHVPQKQRLRDCACVCQAWAAAAAMGTDSIVQVLSTDKVPALQGWLDKHGQQLQSLKASRWRGWSEKPGVGDQLNLSCAGLTQLQLGDIVPILPAADGAGMARVTRAAARATSGSRGVSSSAAVQCVRLSKLVHLRLSTCTLTSTATLLQFSSLTVLARLDLISILLPRDMRQPAKQLSKALAQVLQCLPSLQCLSVVCLELDGSALAPVSTLQRLQDLTVQVSGTCPTATVLAHLPASLTMLSCNDGIDGSSDHQSVGPCLPAQLLQKLSKLQRLHLSHAVVVPAALHGMHGLQDLDMVDCTLRRNQPEHATGMLLQSVGTMRMLTSLHIDGGIEFSELPAQSFTALTVAPGLRALIICMQYTRPPPGTAQHMFPAGKQLSQLTSLFFERRADDEVTGEGCLNAADVRSILAACPALQKLGLEGALLPDAAPALLQLPGSCTLLCLAGDAVGDSAAASVSQLTQLHQLHWRFAPALSDIGFEQLTALRALTRVYFYTIGVSSQLAAAAMGCDLEQGEQMEPYEIEVDLTAKVSALSVVHLLVLHPTVTELPNGWATIHVCMLHSSVAYDLGRVTAVMKCNWHAANGQQRQRCLLVARASWCNADACYCAVLLSAGKQPCVEATVRCLQAQPCLSGAYSATARC